jgi:hypothetical protein
MGVKSYTIGGVPAQDFAKFAADPNTADALANATLIEAEKALADAMASLQRSTAAAGGDAAAMALLSPPTNYGYTAENPSFTYGQNSAPTFVINAPLGSEDTLTEAIQRALQKLNRYGDSTTFAGAL